MSNFKVIIVGGGPVGLIAGHCFSRAGIDFKILERREALDLNAGSSVALWPQSARVLDQLGLLDGAMAAYIPVKYKCNLLPDRRVLSKCDMNAAIQKLHGHHWMLFHRAKLLEILYDRLPDRENKVQTQKEVTGIFKHETGVTVICADGTKHQGSIVLGADGVYSAVRRLMNESVINKDHDQLLPPGLKSTYRGIYGHVLLSPSSHPFPLLTPETLYETHGPHFTFQLIVGPPSCNMLFFFFCARLPSSTPTKGTTRKRTHYTPHDAHSFVTSLSHHHPTPDYTVQDIWSQVTWSHMSDLEEGVIEGDWYDTRDGRIVLAGDAAHKMTPNAGLGLNEGVQDVVGLVNGVCSMLDDIRARARKRPMMVQPSSEDLVETFRAYQSLRRPRAAKVVGLSALWTRMVAWDNWAWRALDKWVTLAPEMLKVNVDRTGLKWLMSPVVAGGLVLKLKGMKERGFREGTVKWKEGVPVRRKEIGNWMPRMETGREARGWAGWLVQVKGRGRWILGRRTIEGKKVKGKRGAWV
ncbi:FAD binding domain-containing protein [Neurospora tetraspora]|uniref:FAD binding domain-containing protein n=1 Tax=Neurospora tetraspora TaxID=94610 RepID=A0AAE0MTT0_9PEZI|nr:FAD binding domain-containing protein [Neurospora tetraspora]